MPAKSPAPSLVWFRQDLRIHDNPALSEAAARGAPVIACYVLDDETPGRWKIGGAGRWWLHHSVVALRAALATRGIPLLLRRGAAGQVIPEFVEQLGAGAVLWNRCYEPFAIHRDTALKAALGERGIDVISCNGSLLHEPWTVETKTGGPFRVFTPYWRNLQARGEPKPALKPPAKQAAFTGKLPPSDALESWKLLPTAPDWAGGFRASWKPGEAGAHKALALFVDDRILDYPNGRNIPGVEQVSRLSPYLHFGELSPLQVWHAVKAATLSDPRAEPAADSYLRQLGWREFSYHLLFHNPTLPEAPLYPRFEKFPWRKLDQDARAQVSAWQRGQTGYPIVDAGMRQLWQTGWMHNRVRMVTASFLIKHLLIDWRYGEAWFWDTLVDADLANNAASWQWVAGSGADASPYVRVFNPVLQGEKFDADGAYVRRYVPELAKLPDKFLHRPWEAPEDVLRLAKVTLGKTYPAPIIDHARARARALAAFEQIRD